MIEDFELLRRYATTRAEEDFAEIVRRHVNLVYSCALRQVNGDAHLAQDVTQIVFADLARKAGSVASHRVLSGWLFTSTRFAAAKAVRGERRRQAREAAAHLMNELLSPDSGHDSDSSLDWARVRPVLDEVLGELGETDREAILLRFFEGRDFAGVGAQLAVNDNTARMRVERALDKLRALLARRGVTSTSAALATALASQAVLAAPAGLVASVTGAAIIGAGATAAASAGSAASIGAWATFMSMTKLQVGLAGALAVAGAAGFLVQTKSNAAMREEIAALRSQNASVAALRADNAQLVRTSAEIADLRGDDAELARLGDESAALKTRLAQVTRAEQKRAAEMANAEVYDAAQLDVQPRPTYQARPQFPFEMRRAGIGGEVVVDFVVGANGEVTKAHPLKISINPKPETPDDTDGAAKPAPFTIAANGVASDPGAVIGGVAAEAMAKSLGESAVQAISQWKFSAGQKGGKPVGTHLQVPLVYTLSEGGSVKSKTAPGAPKP